MSDVSSATRFGQGHRAVPAGSLAGLGAIAVWAWFATLVSWTGPVPPFQLAAMAFAIGGLVSGVWSAALSWPAVVRGPGSTASCSTRNSPVAWFVCVCGLFGNHALYFAALKNAPPAVAGLLNYLWPLLIVLGSALLPGERLRGVHLLGAACGFAGVAALAWGQGGGFEFDPTDGVGYACGVGAAVVWAGYSLLSKLLGPVSAAAFGGCCLVTAALSAACHAAFEATVVPRTAGEWGAILAIGIGPVGAACRLWDVGIRGGDLRLLGVASYATPVLSTLLLILFGFATVSPLLLAACGLIAGGAAVATIPPAPDKERLPCA